MNDTYCMTSTYELVLESLLTESKTDTYARRITQKVVAAVKRKMDDINKKRSVKFTMIVNWPSFIKRKDYFGTPQGRFERTLASGGKVTGNTITLVLGISIVQSKTDIVVVEGSWAPARDTLFIDVHVGSETGSLTTKHIPLIQRKTYMASRHELEHAGQSDEKMLPAFVAFKGLQAAGNQPTPEKVGSYMTAEAEIEAFVAGFYHQAKRERRPFVDVMDEVIHNMVNKFIRRGMNPEDVYRIFAMVRYKWLAYAKQRFPKAVVQT